MKRNKEDEAFDGVAEFSYVCRKCDALIPAKAPNHVNEVKMVQINKTTYEFECIETCKN